MSAVIEEIPQTEAEQQAVVLCEQIKNHAIVTVQDRAGAEREMESLKALEDKIFAYLDPPRDKAYKDYLYHKGRLDDAIKPVQAARKSRKQECIVFDGEQEAIRRAEEARLQAIAQKQAEDEALAMAAQAEAAGDHEIAEAIIAAPVVAPVIRVAPTAPAPSRLTAGRTVWSAVCFDLMALVKAVAAGTQPITLIEPNMPALNKQAQSLHSTMAIPGFTAEERKV